LALLSMGKGVGVLKEEEATNPRGWPPAAAVGQGPPQIKGMNREKLLYL